MKRCDNCGWYNHNSRTTCEKCGEPLSDFIEPDQPGESFPEGFTPSAPMAETHPHSLSSSRRKELSKTVRFEKEESAPAPSVKDYSATVRDVNAVLAASEPECPSSCPKCHYPLAGNPETCPNCGTVLRRSTRKDASHAVPAAPASGMHSTVREGSPQARAAVASQPAAFGKATIRDIPKNLVAAGQSRPAPEEPQVSSNAETFRLVPLADTVTPVVYLREGDIVTIGGKRYRFVK